jgi:hypothetical protein
MTFGVTRSAIAAEFVTASNDHDLKTSVISSGFFT